MRIKRLHDIFYKKEKRFLNPKLSFIELFKILKVKPNHSILDVGCANGELLYNLKKKYRHNKLSGFELPENNSNIIETYDTNFAFLTKNPTLLVKVSSYSLAPEIVEIPDHNWFVGVQFHPELKSKPFDPHPLFTSFIYSAVKQARLV